MSKCRFTGYADHYRYRVLDRMRQDCLYFLGNGNRHEKHLWSGSVKQHISDMREIYESLPEKPEWLSKEDIDALELEMCKEVSAYE